MDSENHIENNDERKMENREIQEQREAVNMSKYTIDPNIEVDYKKLRSCV